MTKKEYKKSLEKLLKTLFKRAENPIDVQGTKQFSELGLVDAIQKVHELLNMKHEREVNQKELTKSVKSSIQKGVQDEAIKARNRLDL